MFAKAEPSNSLRRQRARLRLRDGLTQEGALLIPRHKAARDVVNDEAPFIEFESDAGAVAFFLKDEIARIEPLDGPAPARPQSDPVGERASAASAPRFFGDDPHAVLGVSRDADATAIRRAWIDLARAWHPDRLAALDLPPELIRHAQAVLARVNAAYERLTG